jgi:hypothetical protein
VQYLRRWILVLLILATPATAVAQDARGQPPPTRHDAVSESETVGSAAPRHPGIAARSALPQRLILITLLALVTATLVLGVFTIVHAFGDHGRSRRR